MADDAEPTPKKHRDEVLQENAWKPGQSGNPAGRPKGARNKLGEAFLADMLSDWEEHGATAIAEARESKPEAYLKVVASVLPRELNVRVNDFDDLTDDQLARQFLAIASELAKAGVSVGTGAGTQEAPQPAGELPTIQ